MRQLPLLPLGEYRAFTIVDCETTGLDPDKDRVVEVAAAIYVNGEPVDTFESFVNPGMPIPPQASGLHGIDDDMVADAPDIGTVLQHLDAFAGPHVVVAHNAKFDRQFLTSLRDREWICSLRLARHVWKSAPDYKNGTLRYWLQIKHPLLVGTVPHRAAGDVLTTGFVFERALQAAMLEMPLDANIHHLLQFVESPICVTHLHYGRRFSGRALADIDSWYLSWVLRDAASPQEQRRMNVDSDTLAAVTSELERRRARNAA